MKHRFLFLIALFSLALFSVMVHAQNPKIGKIDDTTPFIEIPIRIENDGDTVSITAQATSGDLDTLVYLVDANSAIVAENDDRATDDTDSSLTFLQAPQGDYTVIVTRFGVEEGKTSGEYDLDIQTSAPTIIEEQQYDVSDEALAQAGYPALDPKPQAEWVVLAYFGGDTNLEPGVMNDFNEFEMAGGSNDQVRIVALLDRHPQFVMSSGDWRTARLFEVQADVSKDEEINFPPTLDTEPLADLGVIDTGDGQNLAQFLVWAIRTYPAKRYAIALASHGGAWQGVITDDSSGNSILTLPELHEAFALARQEAGVERFDLLINDACSMSSVEYHDTLAEDFRYSIASPEIVVDPALNMELFINTLNDNPNISSKDLSKLLIDRYIADTTVNSDRLDSAYLTFALTDMTRFGLVDEAVENFARLVNRDPLRYSNLIGSARANTYTYSSFMGSDDQIDLGDFMRQLLKRTSDTEIIDAANAVLDAIEQVKIYGDAAQRVRERVTYANIYFPQDGKAFKDGYLDVSPLKEWGRMLRDYYNVSAPRLWRVDDSPLTYHPPIAPTVRVTRVYPYESSIISPPTINVEIVGRRIAQGAFTIDRQEADGTIVRLAQTSIVTAVESNNQVDFVNSWKSGVDQSVFQWLPFTLPYVSDGVTSAHELMSLRGSVAALRGKYREPNAERWYDVTVLFNPDGTVANTISESLSGVVADVNIAPNSEFQTYRYVVAPDGSTKQTLGTLYTWGENGITWSERPTQDGKYNLGFLVQAFGGSVGFDAVTINVKNYEEVTDKQGFTDVNLGINFQVGNDWTPVVDYGNWLHSNNPDNTLALNVYYFQADLNVYDIVEEATQRFGLVQEGELKSLRYDGNNGLYFDYTYTYVDGEQWRGRAIAFYRNTLKGGQGVIYSLDAPMRDDAPDATTLFREQLNTLVFIDAQALQSEDSSAWEYRLYNSLIPYPVLQKWDIYEGYEGDWTRLNPENGFDKQTIAYLGKLVGTNPEEELDALLAKYAPDAENIQTRFYRSETHNWYSVAYTATRRVKNELGRVVDMPITGRMYITKLYDTLYAWRFETPTATATTDLRNIFEPMVDGFAPSIAFEGNSKTAFLKAITLAESEDCQQLRWNVVCVGNDDAVSIATLSGKAPQVQSAGEKNRVNDITQITIRPENPYGLAILNLQANLPNRNENEYLRLYVFGGATVTNNVAYASDAITRVQIENINGGSIAIRATTDPLSPQVGSIARGDFADALEISDDGAFVRVRVPMDEAATGWVRREFVEATRDDIEMLPVGNPDEPYYFAFQNIMVTFDENANVLRGLIIRTPDTIEVLYININGSLYEIIGGSLVVWSEATNRLESVSTSTSDDVLDTSDDARRPEPFTPEPTQVAPERVPLTATPGG
jgi:hypothetical protein